MKKPTCITLKDIPGIVSFLVSQGVSVEYRREPGGRVIAEVQGTEEVYRLLAEFQTNPTVNLLDFLEVQKRERGKMMDLRDGGRRYNG